METTNNTEALRVNIILTALDTNKQELADEIGVNRAIVSKVLSGQQRGKRTRKKLAHAICNRIETLIVGEEVEEGAEERRRQQLSDKMLKVWARE